MNKAEIEFEIFNKNKNLKTDCDYYRNLNEMVNSTLVKLNLNGQKQETRNGDAICLYDQETIMLNISSFLKELGNGFSFIDNEYKIKIGNNYNYIDLLLYNVKFKCYVVVELKVTELKKEHIGQIQVYMNYVDKVIKKPHHDTTIGIIISKKNNQFIIEYCSDERIFAREFKITS